MSIRSGEAKTSWRSRRTRRWRSMSNPEESVVEDGVVKTDDPISLTVAAPDAGARRHAPHEPPRQHLFEKRKKVHNKRIDGPFRRFKWLVMFVTLAIYYGTPWIRWDRGPYAPDRSEERRVGKEGRSQRLARPRGTKSAKARS